MSERARSELYLGVDLGTTGLKLGAFDAHGRLHAQGQAGYELECPREGWAEQDARSWLQAFESSLAQVGREVDARRISAICTVGQSPTTVPVDERGEPLRKALTWADRRAVAQARQLSEASGGYVNVEFEVLPRVMWVRDHEPEVFARTRWFFQPYDFLAFHLTGEAVTIEPHRDLAPWSDERLEAAGLERSRFPERPVTPGHVLGKVARAQAERLGLSSEALIVSGTVDAFGHWVGVDLSRIGRLCDIGGTSEGVNLASNERLSDPEHRVFSIPSPFLSGWIVGGAMSNGGSLLDWAVHSLFGKGATRQVVLEAVAKVPPGAGGVLALPYFRGERTPIYDTNARGVFLGVNHSHGPEHLTRALLEGVALGLRQIVDILASLGGSTEEIVVSGGTSRAGAWNRLKADVTGRPVLVPTVCESGMLGAAILARSAACGVPLSRVAGEMVHIEEVIEPDTRNTSVYDELYPLFLDLYQGVREPFEGLARLQLEG